jgi:7-keto-8-aminopelargonate synthetase-like enzyme
MDKLGYNLISRVSCILPVLIGDDTLCEQYSQALDAHGFHVDSIIFPAVGTHQARLRFIMNANHTREQIDRLLAVMKDLKSLPMTMAMRP